MKINLPKLMLAAAFVLAPGMTFANCTYSTQGSIAVAHAGGWVTVPIYTQPGCSWSLSTAANWIPSASPGSGVGTGTMRFYVLPNPHSNARSAWVEQTFGHYDPGTCFSRGGCEETRRNWPSFVPRLKKAASRAK